MYNKDGIYNWGGSEVKKHKVRTKQMEQSSKETIHFYF